MSVHLITGYAGKAHITASDQGSFNAAVMGGGEFVLERGEQLRCQVISNNLVRVYDGDIMMQGRHIMIDRGTYEEVTHENGTAGYQRIDLIVLTYELNEGTGVESAYIEVIKGTPATGGAVAPSYTTGDILDSGAIKNQMPLYKIPFNGLAIGTPVKMFSVVPTLEKMKEEVDEIASAKMTEVDSKISDKLTEIDSEIANFDTNVIKNAVSGLGKIVHEEYELFSSGQIENTTEYTKFIGAAINAVDADVLEDDAEYRIEINVGESVKTNTYIRGTVTSEGGYSDLSGAVTFLIKNGDDVIGVCHSPVAVGTQTLGLRIVSENLKKADFGTNADRKLFFSIIPHITRPNDSETGIIYSQYLLLDRNVSVTIPTIVRIIKINQAIGTGEESGGGSSTTEDITNLSELTNRVAALETSDNAQKSSIEALETSDTGQNSSIESLANRVTALETSSQNVVFSETEPDTVDENTIVYVYEPAAGGA